MKRPRDIWYAAGRDKNKSPGIVNHRNCLHGNRQTMTMCQRHVTRRWTRKHDKNTLPPYFGGEVIFFAADCTAGVSRERAGNLQYFSMEGEQGAGCARWMKKRDFLSREGYGRLVYSFFFFFLRHFTSKKFSTSREISCFVEFVNREKISKVYDIRSYNFRRKLIKVNISQLNKVNIDQSYIWECYIWKKIYT